MDFQSERAFGCPACGAEISVLLETFAEKATHDYIEDCEVCCRPLSIRYTSADHEIESFRVTTTDE
jgi:transcription elongation factor Elf1